MTRQEPLDEIDTFYRGRLAAPQTLRDLPPLSPDYAADLLAALPEGMVGTSFGCGNPVALAGIQPGDTVIDLGCGAGLDVLLAAARTGPRGRVIGIDASAALLDRARANAAKAGIAHAEFREGRIEALPLADASADWVISNCVVNLSMDKPAVFAEIARVLKPGGNAVISDLVAEGLPGWVAAHRDLYAACIAGAVSEAVYTDLARAAGLDDVRVIDRMVYDAGMVRALVAEELPVAIDGLAARLGMGREATLDHVAGELAGCIQSIKLTARRRPG
jgi:arsenite methyltransferase